jgi:glucosylglycerate synthase
MQLIDMVTPLYFARVASFVRQSWEMNSAEAEELVEEQAMKFEVQKAYLLQVWGGEVPEKPSIAC